MNRLVTSLLAATATPAALMAASTAQAQSSAIDEPPMGFVCEGGACVDKRFEFFDEDKCLPPEPGERAEDGSERFMRYRPQDRMVDISEDGKTSRYLTGTAQFEEVNPFLAGEDQDPDDGFDHPERPSNLLPTIYENALDCGGDEIPNTLPSTPENPYNLMTDPDMEPINPTSREKDLRLIIRRMEEAVDPDLRTRTQQTVFEDGKSVPTEPTIGIRDVRGEEAGTVKREVADRLDPEDIEHAIDILEGNPVPDRVWSGIPVLNYVGPEQVTPIECNEQECVAEVHQVWGRQSIMSDTMFYDIPDEAMNREWKVRYTVDIIHRGEEDFAPFNVFFDDPADVGSPGRNGVAMDSTFFPMLPGYRYEFDVKMPPARFFNLTYHWGWRVHSPRIQAIENARKAPGGKNIVKWENEVFCHELDEDGNCTVFPRDNEEAKLNAISMISDYAPAKRMWHAFRKLRRFANGGGRSAEKNPNVRALVEEARAAFDDWLDRNSLPDGFERDEDADLTMVYVNNTMYGAFTDKARDAAQQRWLDWETRGETLSVRLLNGDYFPHQYMNVDFGGNRGWENIFHNTLPIDGQGPWFTFGRAYWFQNMPCPAPVAAAEPQKQKGNPFRRLGPLPARDRAAEQAAKDDPDTILQPELQFCPPPAGTVAADHTEKGFGTHLVEVTYRYEPSQRLRFYQFDPTHHNVQIWSVH